MSGTTRSQEMKKWQLFFMWLLIIYGFIIFLKFSPFIHLTLLSAYLILTIVIYHALSRTLEQEHNDEFIRDSIYLRAIDVRYLNPLSAYIQKEYPSVVCTKLNRLFKAYSLMTLLSFLSMIVWLIISI